MTVNIHTLAAGSKVLNDESYFIGVVPNTEKTELLNSLSYGIVIFIAVVMVTVGLIYSRKKDSNGVMPLKIVTPIAILSILSLMYIHFVAISNEQDTFTNKIIEESNVNFKSEVKERYDLDVLGDDFFVKGTKGSGKNKVTTVSLKDGVIMVKDKEGKTLEAQVYLSQDNSSVTVDTKEAVDGKKSIQ